MVTIRSGLLMRTKSAPVSQKQPESQLMSRRDGPTPHHGLGRAGQDDGMPGTLKKTNDSLQWTFVGGAEWTKGLTL